MFCSFTGEVFYPTNFHQKNKRRAPAASKQKNVRSISFRNLAMTNVSSTHTITKLKTKATQMAEIHRKKGIWNDPNTIIDHRRVRKESCPMDAEVNNHSRWEENICHHLCSVIQMMRKAQVTRSAQCRNSSSYQSCFPKCSNHDIRFSVKDYQHLAVHCFVFDQRQIAIFKQFGR